MRFRFLLMAWLTATLFLAALPARADDSAVLGYTKARLISEYRAIDGKGGFWVLFQLDIQKGWHTYWKNPGDSGETPTLKWRLPPGVTASAILWQPPQRLPLGPLTNYGYSDTSYHLVRITPPEGQALSDTLPLQLDARWLVCAEECVPEKATLTLEIPVGDANKATQDQTRIRKLVDNAMLASLPITSTTSTPDTLTISVPGAADIAKGQTIREAYFYPEAPGIIVPSASQQLAVDKSGLHLTMQRGLLPLPQRLQGVLELHDDKNTRHIAVAQPETEAIAKPVDFLALLLILAGAFLGGVLLNVMPCVFPVLSLKALAIAKKANKKHAAIRMQGFAYTAGVLASFAVIGGLLLALKAAGHAAGWGYQMQAPLFVAALIYLLFLVGLNLSGYFNINFSFGGGQSYTEKKGWLGSFATGVLAVLVATPCTAPFMATALGAALVLPTLPAMMIFLALGLGLAFPFLLLTLFPQKLSRWLPKPGAWMERFKQLLAFPIYLTIVWLLWVVGQQTGTYGMMLILAGLTGTGFMIWAWPFLPRGAFLRIVVIFLLLVGASFPFPLLYLSPPAGAMKTANDGAEVFSEAALAQHRAAGKRVFVYATASWCITCKFNEQVALETAAVKNHFAARNVVVMRADWTSADPAITNWLAQFGRNGVPLYVYYPAEGDASAGGVKNGAIILPQLLTPNIVIDTIR